MTNKLSLWAPKPKLSFQSCCWSKSAEYRWIVKILKRFLLDLCCFSVLHLFSFLSFDASERVNEQVKFLREFFGGIVVKVVVLCLFVVVFLLCCVARLMSHRHHLFSSSHSFKVKSVCSVHILLCVQGEISWSDGFVLYWLTLTWSPGFGLHFTDLSISDVFSFSGTSYNSL